LGDHILTLCFHSSLTKISEQTILRFLAESPLLSALDFERSGLAFP
jgi:hypothetical protein